MRQGACAIYFLDVPEFEPLVRGLENARGVKLYVRGAYRVAEGTEIVLDRDATKIGDAVWFGALTGGVDGRVLEFSESTLRIAPRS